MPVVQPLPLIQTPSPNHEAQPRPFPVQKLDQKERLCWVHRPSKTSQQQYLWPAVYYVNWTEACHELSRVLTPPENKALCLQLYSRGGNLSTTTVVAKLILGSGQMEFVELSTGSDAVFGQFFGGYFAQAIQRASNASFFDQDKEYYSEFKHAVDQAVGLANDDPTYDPTSSRLLQDFEHDVPCVDPVVDMAATKPSAASVTQEACSVTLSESSRLTTVSPSSTSQAETPKHTNQTEILLATQPSEQRTLFSSTSSSSSSSVQEDHSSAAATPYRTSSRPRRSAVRTRAHWSTPTSSKTQASLRDSDDDDDFYKFNNLIALLTKTLGWRYRSASNHLCAWVYERPGTAGEKGGKILEDYFYEEAQVVEYCKAHNFKKLYGHVVEDATNSYVTPSPRKKSRSSKASIS